jgi:hypothetical protein
MTNLFAPKPDDMAGNHTCSAGTKVLVLTLPGCFAIDRRVVVYYTI